MASVKRLSLITKCLAVVLAMASFPYDTKGVPNNNENSSIAVFQDRNIARVKRQLTRRLSNNMMYISKCYKILTLEGFTITTLSSQFQDVTAIQNQ